MGTSSRGHPLGDIHSGASSRKPVRRIGTLVLNPQHDTHNRPPRLLQSTLSRSVAPLTRCSRRLPDTSLAISLASMAAVSALSKRTADCATKRTRRSPGGPMSRTTPSYKPRLAKRGLRAHRDIKLLLHRTAAGAKSSQTRKRKPTRKLGNQGDRKRCDRSPQGLRSQSHSTSRYHRGVALVDRPTGDAGTYARVPRAPGSACGGGTL